MVKKRKTSLKLDALGSIKIDELYSPKSSPVLVDKTKIVKTLNWQKNLFAFAFLSGFLVLVIFGLSEFGNAKKVKKEVLGAATIGFDFLNDAKDDLLKQNGISARDGFSRATASFESAQREVQEAQGVVGALVNIFPQGRDLNNVLEGSANVSEALIYLSNGLDTFSTLTVDWQSDTSSTGLGLFSGIRDSREQFVKAQSSLEAASLRLSDVDVETIPAEFQESFAKSLGQLALASAVLDDLVGVQDILVQLLGGESKKYLIVFQNNDEIRASGGFIGTYGVIDFKNGQMKIEKIESIYHLAGQLRRNITPPVPVARLLNDTFNIQDSNWFVDFPTSARKILEFYELTSGSLADGVIAMTPDVFESLLEITGPVVMDEYGEVLTAANFRERVQIKTSLEYDRVLNRPKKLLSDFAPKLFSKISSLSSNDFISLFDVLSSMVTQKQILVFSLDQEIQKNLSDSAMTGEIKQTNGDYLSIFHSSVGGGKTSQSVDSKVRKKVSIDEDGNAIVTVSITRRHQDFAEEFFPRNIDYMRVLIPSESEVVSISGFDDILLSNTVKPGFLQDSDIKEWQNEIELFSGTSGFIGSEAGYKTVNGWLELDPGESKNVQIEYRLNNKVGRLYSNLLQKQPGAQSFDFTLEIESSRKPVYVYPDRAETAPEKTVISEIITSDRIQAVIFE